MNSEELCAVCGGPNGVACPTTDYPVVLAGAASDPRPLRAVGSAPEAAPEAQAPTFHVAIGFRVPGRACGDVPIICPPCQHDLVAGAAQIINPKS